VRRTSWLFTSISLVLSLLTSPHLPFASAADQVLQEPAGAQPLPVPTTAQPREVKYLYKGKEITKSAYEALMMFNQSFEPMKKGKYALAAEKLAAALKLDPNLYQARTNYGFMLGRLGRAEEGIAELKKALEIDPTRPEAITTIAAMYQATGRISEAIFEYKRALQRYPKSPLAVNISSVIKQLEQEYKREQAIEKSITPAQNSEDYFAHATYDSVAKWPTTKFPLKVYLQGDDETQRIANFRPEFGAAIKQAFKDWADASKNAFEYEFTRDFKKSDIDVYWTSDPTKVSRPSEGGEARVSYDTIHGINHVQIIVLTITPDGTDHFVPLNIIKAACLHEVGHSLGILGHSPDPNDVMFCSVPAADTDHPVTSRDGKTLAHLYQNEVRLAHHYRETVGENDKYSLNNEGVNLAGAQQFARAVEKFEAALKLDPAYEPSRQNLGACLNNLAIELAKTNKYPEAAIKFKRSLELQQNSKDQERKVTTMRNYAVVLTNLNRNSEAAMIKTAADKLTADSAVTSLKK